VVGRHLQEIARQEAFLALPQPLLVELVRDDSLAVRSEVTVYEAVMGWVRSDAERRRGAIGEVLGAVRLGLLPAPFLAETVATDPLIEPSFDARGLLVKALSCHTSETIRDGADSGSLLRRRTRPADQGLLVIGGRSDAGGVLAASVECYDAQWRAVLDKCRERARLAGALGRGRNLKIGREACGGAYVEGLVYVVGGYHADRLVASADCYDPSTGEWQEGSDMSVERADCAAACVDGFLYVVGGYDCAFVHDGSTEVLASAECYDPSTRAWRALPDMSFARYRCAAACINGLLYVVGGADNDNLPFASAECYDPSTRDWLALPDMSAERCWCAAASVDGLLYVVGGADHNKRALASAECYDPSTIAWRALPDMSIARTGCAAASIDGLLYVVGGEDALGRPVASAECYDPSTQQWRSLPDMSVARAGCVFVAVALR
jgi:hypothetical protein